MNILYCGDSNIKDGLIISILSLLKNVKTELHIYVLTISLVTPQKTFYALQDNDIEFLDQKVKKQNANNFVKKIDITSLFEKEKPTANMNTRFTPFCMLRLYADQINELPNKILYLDNDVVCRKDCTEFYNTNIENFEFAGVLDFYGKWFFKNKQIKFNYINSGVLLLNLAKIKETKLFEKARKMCQTEKIFMPDQSALNKLAKAKKIMPRKYNEQRKLHKATVFQHFTTSFRLFPWFHSVTIKPWQIDEVHNKLKIHDYDDIFTEYESIKSEM